jgi:uncharacterized membrane protein YbhN (UPF0104 family)
MTTSDTDLRERRKKWLLLTAKLLAAAIVIWAVHRTLYTAWQQAGQYDWQLEPLWLVVAGGLYLGGLSLAGLFWHHVLRTLGQDARWGESLRAYLIGHLGKYAPGKAMVIVLRAGLIRSERVNTGVAAVSVFFETMTMMGAGAFWGAAVLAAGFRGEGHFFASAVLVMVLSTLSVLPPVFRRLARLLGVGKSDPAVADKLRRLGYGTLVRGWATMTVSWCLLGLSLWATLRAMGLEGIDPVGQLPRYTACVSLAVVAGFVLVVLPGGLGVREAALIQLLVPYLKDVLPASPDRIGQASLVAVAAAALLRLIWLLSEIAAAALCYAIHRLNGRVARRERSNGHGSGVATPFLPQGVPPGSDNSFTDDV